MVLVPYSGNSRVKGKFETLLNGGSLIQTVSDELTYDTLHSSEDNLWSVLFMTGYVTKADAGETGETEHLRIPNREIATIFEDTVVSLFRETMDISLQRSMMEAFWNGDEVTAGKALSDLLWKTISYNDYHEDYYHTFLAGIFTGLGYEVESNREKGPGRPDILLKDDENRRAVIIEGKRSAAESDMEKDCIQTSDQIRDNKYAEGLDGHRQILCYGIAFYKNRQKHSEWNDSPSGISRLPRVDGFSSGYRLIMPQVTVPGRTSSARDCFFRLFCQWNYTHGIPISRYGSAV